MRRCLLDLVTVSLVLRRTRFSALRHIWMPYDDDLHIRSQPCAQHCLGVSAWPQPRRFALVARLSDVVSTCCKTQHAKIDVCISSRNSWLFTLRLSIILAHTRKQHDLWVWNVNDQRKCRNWEEGDGLVRSGRKCLPKWLLQEDLCVIKPLIEHKHSHNWRGYIKSTRSQIRWTRC